jgi:TolA-binding protein
VVDFFRLLKLTIFACIFFASALLASRENTRLLAGAARQAARGDTATALQVIERVLAQPGRDESKGLALYLKGVIQTAQGESDSAEESLRKMIVEYPRSEVIGAALTQLGLICSRQGRDSAAVRCLEPVVASFPDSSFTAPALLTLARSAERSGLEHKALESNLDYLAGVPDEANRLKTMERCASLLFNAGRVNEAYALIESIRLANKKELYELDLPIQMIALGCFTGLGKADSSLRLAEELRRRSGDSPFNSPRLLFLLGHAHLALGHLAAADSIFSSLAGRKNLKADGIGIDSLYHLLMDVNLGQKSYEDYFRYANEALRSAGDPQKAMLFLTEISRMGIRTGILDPVAQALEIFFNRFNTYPEAKEARLIQAQVASRGGGRDQAVKILSDLLAEAGTDSILKARITLTRGGLYLELGDTLRAEAELLDYLDHSPDVLDIKDSVLWENSGIKRSQDKVREEAAILERLTSGYPASRFWDRASDRLEEIRLFELTDPTRAANELLDILERESSQIPSLRLADLAANYLGDYERALSILQKSPPKEPEARLKIIKYRYLSGLKLNRKGSVAARERISQAWREIRYLLAQESSFTGREEAVSLFLKIYKSIYSSMNSADIREADNLLRKEITGLGPGNARSSALSWLAERYMAKTATDSGMAAFILADSARAMWNQAIGSGGDMNVTGKAILNLATSLENALFAGAQDSAANLYGLLINRYPGSRWASLAGLRLGIIHLRQDHYSLAYRTINDWVQRNLYASKDPQAVVALAEASFLTGIYARAYDLLSDLDRTALDSRQQRTFRCYQIRALTKMGRFAEASGLLLGFLNDYRDKLSQNSAAAAAVELYWASGSPQLAEHYLAEVPPSSDTYPVARIFSLRGQLVHRGDTEKLRREFEKYKKSPWNAFFRIDPAFEAYRGIMACYMAEGKLDKVEENRNEFRKSYPERRSGLAELTLDEIEYLISNNNLVKAAPLYDDLSLLFRDVYPEDRALWVGYRLEQARGDAAKATRNLEDLAGKFPLSPYGAQARLKLAGLYLSAGQIEKAKALLNNLPAEAGVLYAVTGLKAAILGAGGKWHEALGQRREQWSMARVGEPAEESLLGWAEAALKAGQARQAVEILTALWSPDSGMTARARFALGLEYQAEGKFTEALETMEVVSELFSDRSEIALKALFQMGLIQEAMGDIEDAVRTYQSLETRAGERSDWARSARDRLRTLPSTSRSQTAPPAK